MNSIFLRIYGGMCAALILVAVLGVLALNLLNQVRSEQYRERLAHGTFSLMADNLQPMNQTERHRALLVWERLLGIPLTLKKFSETDLDLAQRTRVLRGQALVEQTGPHAAKVYRLISEKEQMMLVGEVQQISEQLARATIYLLADELVRFPVGEQPKRLAQLKEEKGFGFDLRLVTVNEADKEAFIAASKPIYDEFASSVDGGGDLIETVLGLAK